MAAPIPLLWLTGPVGVGKSTTAWAVHEELTVRGVASAFVDLDQLGMCHPAPAPDEDPENHRIKSAALAAVLPGYLAAGARCVVVSGNAPDRATVDLHVAAVPDATVTVVRLRLAEDELRRRIVARGTFLDELDGLLEYARGLDDAGLDAVVVDLDGVPRDRLAAHVLSHLDGWP